MNFGNLLKKQRRDIGLTQEELAKKINTSRSNIANYENNKNLPSLDALESLAKFLNCSVDYLMGKSFFKNYNDYTKAVKHSVAVLEFCEESELGFINNLIFEVYNFEIKDLEYIENFIYSEVSSSRFCFKPL